MATKRTGDTRVKAALACVAISLLAPLLVFIAAAGVKTGAWDRAFAFDVLTLKAAWALAWVGAAAAVGALILAFGAWKRAGLFAALAIVVAGLTIGQFLRHDAGIKANLSSQDVSTNPADPPVFSRQIMAVRPAGDAALMARWAQQGARCPAAVSVPTQVAPGVAGYALKEAGFEVAGIGVGRADGSHHSFWFGFTHDAVVRIRPGRTDVRVTARDGRDDGGEACRLATRIVEVLQTSL